MKDLLLVGDFDLLGLTLKNPTGFILSVIITILSFIFYRRLKSIKQGDFSWWWRLFFLLFSITSLMKGLGQLFYHYTDNHGMIPALFFAFSANLIGARAMLTFKAKNRTKNLLILTIFLKFLVLLIVALATGKYVLAYFDAIITCVGFVFILGMIQFFRSKEKHWLWAFLSIIPLFPSFLIHYGSLGNLLLNGQILTEVLSAVSLLMLFIANNVYLKQSR